MLASVVNFFNPSHVFIGGGITRIGPLFLAAVRQSVYHRSLALSTRHLEIQYTPLGEQAGADRRRRAGACRRRCKARGGSRGMSHDAASPVDVRRRRQGLRPGAGAARRELRAGAGPRLRPARRERRRQVDADEDPRGLRGARAAASCASTARPVHFDGLARGRGAGHRADPPGVQPRRRPDDRAEHLPRPREEARLAARRRRDARARPPRVLRAGRAWTSTPTRKVRAPDRRREAAGRDRQGAGAPGAPADHGRAHRDADARRDRAPVRADRAAARPTA